jgi:peptide/nickel transport system substrate-binding protein
MKRFGWQWLAASSLVLLTAAAMAETRPQYGGTLRVMMRAAPSSIDPADRGISDCMACRNVCSLVFETLLTRDSSGHLNPALAEAWQATPGTQRWVFHIRTNVKFHDGTAVGADSIAASLRQANPTWNIVAEKNNVSIETDAPDREFPAELALPKNSIVRRGAESKLSGTGPFRILDWQPGKQLTLGADEDYWGGRPFLDGIEIEFGRNGAEELAALRAGRTDLAEIAPEQARRVSQDGVTVLNSASIELLALVFSRAPSSPDEKNLRAALALCIDRASIRDVLLQGAGQPGGSILPTWISGYGFVFPSGADLAKARLLREQVRTVPTWKLGYDATNSLDRLIAERVALNARDAGLSLQPTPGSNADLRLARIPFLSSDPAIDLERAATTVGLPYANGKTGSVEELYENEKGALTSQRLIPLFHLPVSYAFNPNLRNCGLSKDGSWNLSNAWLEAAKP